MSSIWICFTNKELFSSTRRIIPLDLLLYICVVWVAVDSKTGVSTMKYIRLSFVPIGVLNWCLCSSFVPFPNVVVVFSTSKPDRVPMEQHCQHKLLIASWSWSCVNMYIIFKQQLKLFIDYIRKYIDECNCLAKITNLHIECVNCCFQTNSNIWNYSMVQNLLILV